MLHKPPLPKIVKRLYPPPPWTKFREGELSCPSASLSVYLYVCLCSFVTGHYLYCCFDTGWLYLALWCTTMRQFVAYIFDPNATMIFDFKVKFIKFLTCLCVQSVTFFALTLASHIGYRDLSPLANGSRTFIVLYHVDLWP